ncbi:hypothetical protein C8Q76DRAFT_699019 [Earliella scabrosa]|nr:hypothetical protein C8Q76DRAFT_699019 [Earliella scabrosa]
MAQRPSNDAPYTFGARALIRPNRVTDLVYSAAVAPDWDEDAEMTITRCFHDESVADVKMDVDHGPGPAPVTMPRSALRATTPAHGAASQASHVPASSPATPQPSSSTSSTPRPSQATSESSIPTTSAPLSSPASEGTEPFADNHEEPDETHVKPAPSMPRSRSSTPLQEQVATPARKTTSTKRPNGIKRSSMHAPLRVEPVPARTSNVNANSATNKAYVPYEDDDIRRQYARDHKTCSPTDEEKRSDVRFETAWFYSSGDYTLSAPPPAMARHPELVVGDVFFHCARNLPDPQMWAWAELPNGQRVWKVVCKGDTRPEDDRKLAIGQDDLGRPRPNWVTLQWYRKLGYKERLAAKKGKARARSSEHMD